MNNMFNVENMTQFEFGAIVLTVLIAGLVMGCLIAYGVLKRKNSPNAAAAVKIQEEFEEYKEKVDDHFNKTSEMFKDVTTQYKKLYDHMAVGAIELSNADTVAMPRLEMQEDSEPDETPANDDDVVVSDSEPEQTDQAEASSVSDQAHSDVADEAATSQSKEQTTQSDSITEESEPLQQDQDGESKDEKKN